MLKQAQAYWLKTNFSFYCNFFFFYYYFSLSICGRLVIKVPFRKSTFFVLCFIIIIIIAIINSSKKQMLMV